MQHKAGKEYAFTQKDIDIMKQGAIYAANYFGYRIEIGEYTDKTVHITIKDIPEQALQTAQKDVTAIISKYVYVSSEEIRNALRAGRTHLFKKPEDDCITITVQAKQ